jgi:hypothetical protein
MLSMHGNRKLPMAIGHWHDATVVALRSRGAKWAGWQLAAHGAAPERDAECQWAALASNGPI